MIMELFFLLPPYVGFSGCEKEKYIAIQYNNLKNIILALPLDVFSIEDFSVYDLATVFQFDV